MTIKRFLIPSMVITIILFILNLNGLDDVFNKKNDDTTNLTKYVQAKRSIIQNYFGTPDIEEMYKKSIEYMVNALTDSTLEINNSPIDTSFTDIEIFSIRDSYENFESAYLYISNNSPDEDMSRLTESAIRGLFSTLDPHSVFIEAEVSEADQENFAGKFQGIGVQFQVINDTITVITAIAGGPSDQLGIQSGDRIIEIEDSSSVGFSNEQVVNRLRGEKGTEVDVTIIRPGVLNPIYFTIIRDDIPIYTVDSSYMLDDQTGYIKINRFAATTHDEFIQALDELLPQGLERLVLDLRGNPGGYLGQAVASLKNFYAWHRIGCY